MLIARQPLSRFAAPTTAPAGFKGHGRHAHADKSAKRGPNTERTAGGAASLSIAEQHAPSRDRGGQALWAKVKGNEKTTPEWFSTTTMDGGTNIYLVLYRLVWYHPGQFRQVSIPRFEHDSPHPVCRAGWVVFVYGTAFGFISYLRR